MLRRRDTGLARLEAALAALEETEAELSTWRDSSDISPSTSSPSASHGWPRARLCRMFADVWDWHRETGGAFDPAIGRLLRRMGHPRRRGHSAPRAHARALASSGHGAAVVRPNALHGDPARRRRDRRRGLRQRRRPGSSRGGARRPPLDDRPRRPDLRRRPPRRRKAHGRSRSLIRGAATALPSMCG